MGIFKNNLNLGLQYAFLIKLGFEYGERSGAQGECDYTKTIHHNGNETLWLTVNPKERKLYLYNEWDCGGVLWQRKHDIPQSVLDNEKDFIDWLDEKIGND